MRYIAAAYAQDTRPEKIDGKDAPKGGWRTKSGVKKLGKRATFDAKNLGEAVTKTAELVAGLSPANQKRVVKVVVALDTASPEAGGNPFDV